jgi:hypothetical protein
VTDFKAVEKSVGSEADGQSAKITWFTLVHAVHALQIFRRLHYISPVLSCQYEWKRHWLPFPLSTSPFSPPSWIGPTGTGHIHL